MNFGLEIVDFLGRQVVLDHANWAKHVRERPEIGPHHDDLVIVLSDPDLLMVADRDGHHHFYRGGLTTGPFRNHYVHVVVEYLGVGSWGTLKTCWLSPVVDTKGQILWMRPRTR